MCPTPAVATSCWVPAESTGFSEGPCWGGGQDSCRFQMQLFPLERIDLYRAGVMCPKGK